MHLTTRTSLPLLWSLRGTILGSGQSLGGGKRIGVQRTSSLAVFDLPDHYPAFKVRGENPLTIRSEARAKGEITTLLQFAQFLAAALPERDRVVTSAGDETVGMTIIDREHAAGVGSPVLCLFAFLHLPEFHRPIFAGRREQLGIAAPAQRGDGGFVPREREEFLRAFRIPNADAAVAIRGGQHLAVGTERDCRNPIGVLLELVLKLAGLGGPHLHDADRKST